MKILTQKLAALSDDELLEGFDGALWGERDRQVEQLFFLVEMEKRRLTYHYPSLWKFLTEEKGLDGTCATRRIHVARLLVQVPALAEKLQAGRFNLSLLELALGVFHKKELSMDQKWEILNGIEGKSVKRARRVIFSYFPDIVKIPFDRVRPVSEELSEVRFVTNDEILESLEEVKGLLAYSHPGIKMGDLVGLLAREYLKRHHPEEKAKRAEAREMRRREGASAEAQPVSASASASDSADESDSAPEPSAMTPISQPTSGGCARRPKAALVHELVRTQGYECAYVDPKTQKKCGAWYGLEHDHITAVAVGGKTELSNLRFLCRTHNLRAAILRFGQEKIQKEIHARRDSNR